MKDGKPLDTQRPPKRHQQGSVGARVRPAVQSPQKPALNQILAFYRVHEDDLPAHDAAGVRASGRYTPHRRRKGHTPGAMSPVNLLRDKVPRAQFADTDPMTVDWFGMRPDC